MKEEKTDRIRLDDEQLLNASGGALGDGIKADFLKTMRLRCPDCSKLLNTAGPSADGKYTLECSDRSCGYKTACTYSEALRYIL